MAVRIAHIVTAVHTKRRIIFQRKEQMSRQRSVALHPTMQQDIA